VRCSLIEEKSDENFDVEQDEEDEDVNDDQESSCDHYSCHGEKEDEEWLVTSTWSFLAASCRSGHHLLFCGIFKVLSFITIFQDFRRLGRRNQRRGRYCYG